MHICRTVECRVIICTLFVRTFLLTSVYKRHISYLAYREVFRVYPRRYFQILYRSLLVGKEDRRLHGRVPIIIILCSRFLCQCHQHVIFVTASKYVCVCFIANGKLISIA